METPRVVRSSAYAAILTIAFVVIITVWADLSAPLKTWLTNFSGHHWTSKSILSVLLYVFAVPCFYALPYKNDGDLSKVLGGLLIASLSGVLMITGFYTAHYFGLV